MLEKQLSDFATGTRRSPSADFTTNVFGRIGIDRYTKAHSSIGEVYVGWTSLGASGLRSAADETAFEAWYGERFGRRAVRALENDAIADAIARHLGGEDVDVPLDLSASSPFETAVLRQTAQIGRGEARPYWWLARELGAAGATRAVGNALGRNPLPLLIPCHRVIRADMHAGNYVFGHAAKERLLAAEGVDLAALERISRHGFRYIGCDDGYFCLPTCGDIACKVDRPGYIGLQSVGEAQARGLRPCRTCRPIAA